MLKVVSDEFREQYGLTPTPETSYQWFKFRVREKLSKFFCGLGVALDPSGIMLNFMNMGSIEFTKICLKEAADQQMKDFIKKEILNVEINSCMCGKCRPKVEPESKTVN